MVCSYCKNTVKFRDLYTCKELEKDVAEMINLIRNSQSQLESGSFNDRNEEQGERPEEDMEEDESNNRDNEGEEEEGTEVRTSQQSFDSQATFSSMNSYDANDVDFNREVLDININNDIEVEEYCYIIDTYISCDKKEHQSDACARRNTCCGLETDAMRRLNLATSSNCYS